MKKDTTQNLEALNIQLTPAELLELETAFTKLKVYGGRMNAMQMGFCE